MKLAKLEDGCGLAYAHLLINISLSKKKTKKFLQKKKIKNMFLFVLKLHINVVQSMMRIQQVPPAVEIQAAATIRQSQHVPAEVAVDAAQQVAAAIIRHHPHRRKHVARIHASEKIAK